MGQLEDDMRQLRGKLEENENTVNKISGKIDKIIADIDFSHYCNRGQQS